MGFLCPRSFRGVERGEVAGYVAASWGREEREEGGGGRRRNEQARCRASDCNTDDADEVIASRITLLLPTSCLARRSLISRLHRILSFVPL